MIKELKTLIAVAREGTFAAAGDRIGLTQAAVSAQMQRLEAQLGVELFDRKGRSAQLNRMGQQVLLQGQELVRLYGSLGNSATGSAPNVLVTIGAIASVQRSFLPDALALFHRQFPQCRTRVIPGLSMDLVNQVDAGEVDLAAIIRPPFSLHSDLRWTTLMREPYRLIVPADLQGEDWAELISSQPFIRYDRSSFGGRQVDRFLRQTHVSLREVCELDELDAIVKLVANGVGVALVPETATIQAWPAGVRAVDLGPHTFHRDIGLVHRERRSLAEPVNVLARLLIAQVQDTQ
ncbi:MULTISPECIES: LysR family transcriptional regulator [Pseudomonas syringae group]|uniref:LysR family transcriptional regulator n=2 Tax=Pseudomonas syringae group TaxID=136849 RepID=A0ABY1U5X3_PSESX|nr:MULTISPECIES: LysR family transcriptional regulator [Pseudomonas syringae group]KWT06442.1 LysR family transcriptional regulator [Pseudomonas syringae pv. avii]PHN67814.1 LysR family transcriptional regulator [Pseudomonas syringae]POQ08912.1 LysR family transcriptional regulator [Pseudomonas syringae pv. avii]RMR16913.1 Transcriptional regulator, LysR family [Pseudomonas syringae pv. persicae]SOQ09140.1 LysR family transcriptional regulator [Pseudomonas syringae pv. persicae]